MKVTDDRELRPWLRSFYKRLIDLKGLNFDIAEDLAQMVDVNENGLRQHDTSFSPSMPWSIPPTCHYQSRPSKAHMQLFNEYFSIYYAVIGAVLMTIYSDDREAFLEEEIQMIMDEVIKAYEAQLACKVSVIARYDLGIDAIRGLYEKRRNGDQGLLDRQKPVWHVAGQTRSIAKWQVGCRLFKEISD